MTNWATARSLFESIRASFPWRCHGSRPCRSFNGRQIWPCRMTTYPEPTDELALGSRQVVRGTRKAVAAQTTRVTWRRAPTRLQEDALVAS